MSIRGRPWRKLEHHSPRRPTRSKLLNRPDAHFLGSFSLTSSVFWKVVSCLWNVPIVHARAPLNRVVESYGSSRTTNAKRRRPIPDDDGPGSMGTGTWLEEEPNATVTPGLNCRVRFIVLRWGFSPYSPSRRLPCSSPGCGWLNGSTSGERGRRAPCKRMNRTQVRECTCEGMRTFSMQYLYGLRG
jgi:hypothetical protein